MPKKKTGQRKKAEKQKELQKKIRSGERDLGEQPCNAQMVAYFGVIIKNRFYYNNFWRYCSSTGKHLRKN